MSYIDFAVDVHKLTPSAAVLLAGGLSQRMGGGLKPFIELKGKWILDYSVEAFRSVQAIAEICIVAPVDQHEAILKRYGTNHLFCAKPGVLRQDSFYNGLALLGSHHSYVITHDAARPLVTDDLICQVLLAAQQQGAALCAMPIVSTVKKSKEGRFVERTVDRNGLWEAQTPQAARRELFEEAFIKANRQKIEVTDDVQLIELLGCPVAIVSGYKENIKITTRQDLPLAEFYLQQKASR